MAKKNQPKIILTLRDDGLPEARFYNFDSFTPPKIERCFEAAVKEWHRLRAEAVMARRKKELSERQQEVGATNA